MGLALGTKLTIAGPDRGDGGRRPADRAAGLPPPRPLLFLGGVAITAGFWFLRNLIHSGSPLPWLQDIGPIDLPGPGRGLEGRDDFSVAHYLFANPDVDVWKDFYKAITNLLGPVWFVLLGATALGAILAVWRPRSAAVRLCGVVAIAGGDRLPVHPADRRRARGRPARLRDQPPLPGPGLRPRPGAGAARAPPHPRARPPAAADRRARRPARWPRSTRTPPTSGTSPSPRYPWAALIGVVLIGVPVGLALLARRSAAARRRRRGRCCCSRSPRSAGSARTTTSTTATTARRGLPLPARRRRRLGQGHERRADRGRGDKRRLQPVRPLR